MVPLAAGLRLIWAPFSANVLCLVPLWQPSYHLALKFLLHFRRIVVNCAYRKDGFANLSSVFSSKPEGNASRRSFPRP